MAIILQQANEMERFLQHGFCFLFFLFKLILSLTSTKNLRVKIVRLDTKQPLIATCMLLSTSDIRHDE